jgi:hypothetical protein
MPKAICNNCNELITWRAQRNCYLKDQHCKCGSTNLTAVSSRFNDDITELLYYERSGKLRKVLPYVVRQSILS